jgi:hypothetical protein
LVALLDDCVAIILSWDSQLHHYVIQ